MTKVAVLVLYSGSIDRDHLRSMQSLTVPVFAMHDHPLIDQARSYLASLALSKSDADVFVWIDDDIVFNAADVERLANSGAFVGAAYSVRAPGGAIIGGGIGEEFTFFEGGTVRPVPTLGMGFTAIHRNVYEAVGKDLPEVAIGGQKGTCKPYFANLIENGNYYGEDASFCLRAARAGFAPHVNTTIRVLHKGEYLYGIEDAMQPVQRKNSLSVSFKEMGQ